MKHSNHSEHQPDGMGYDMHEGHRKTGPKDDDHTTELNKARNAENAGVISMDASRATVRVIRTDEELMIARSVCRALGLDME